MQAAERKKEEKYPPARKAMQWLSTPVSRELLGCCWKPHEDGKSRWLSLPQHYALGNSLWKKEFQQGNKKDNFYKTDRTPTGKVSEEAASRKYRNISLKRSIFLYEPNLTFLPVFFLSSRTTPAAPCYTAGSSFLKEKLSRCQIQSEQCRQLRWWERTRASILEGLKHSDTGICSTRTQTSGLPRSPGFLGHFSQLKQASHLPWEYPKKGKCCLKPLAFEINI